MFNGFVFVLLFTEFCSSTDVNAKDFNITSLLTPTTLNSSVPESAGIRSQRNTPELAKTSKCNNNQLVEKILKIVHTIMENNVERQTQTSNLINLLIKIIEKNVDSFNKRETKLIYDILNNIEASGAIHRRVDSDSIRPSHLRISSYDNKSFCPLALLKIQAFLHLIDKFISDELSFDSKKYIETECNPEDSNARDPAKYQTIYNLFIVKPINWQDLETENEQMPIDTEDEVPVHYIPMTNPTEINVQPYSNIDPYIYLNENVEDKIPIVIPDDEYYDFDHKPTINPTEINVQPYSNIEPYTYLNENVEDKIPIVIENYKYYDSDHKPTIYPTEINVQSYSNIDPYIYLNENIDDEIPIVTKNDKYYDFDDKPMTNPTDINIQPYSNIDPYGYMNKNVEDKIPIVIANDKYKDFDQKPTIYPTDINVQPYSNIDPYIYLNENVEDKIPIVIPNDEYNDFHHKPMTNPTEINIQPYSNIDPYGYINENVEDKIPIVIANDKYNDFDHKPMTNPTEINVQPYSNISPYIYLNENVEDKIPIVIANDKYDDFDHKPTINPSEINFQPYSNIDPYIYLNENVEDKIPVVIANDEYYDFGHKPTTNPTETNVHPYSNIDSYKYLYDNIDDEIPIITKNEKYYDFDDKPMTNPTDINIQPYSNIDPYGYMNKNVEDKIPIVIANDKYKDFDQKPTTNPIETNVHPYSNIDPYTYLYENVDDEIPIVTKNDKYYHFDHKPMTNPTELNKEEEIDKTYLKIWKPKQLNITVPKKKHVVEHVTPKILLVPNYSLSNNDNLNVDNVKTTTKRTVNTDDVDNEHYLYNKRYPEYDYNYVDTELSSEKPINSAGILQINVVSTTKSPMPYYDYEDTMPFYNGNSQPKHDYWIDNQNPWNDKYYLYNDNKDKEPQGHTSLVNVTSNAYKNDEPLHSWQKKPSNYYVEENLVPMDGHKLVPNVYSDWYDQSDIEVEFTTQQPLSIEVTSLDHYSNGENPFYNSFLNIELTTKATPITIDSKYSYPIYNVLTDGDNYGTKKDTNDGSWNKNYPKYYKHENIHLSYPETFDITPVGILDQVTEETIPLNEFTNPDNPHQTDDLNIPINYDIIENVTPSNYAENLETTTKIIHVIEKDHIMYHIPPSYPVTKEANVIRDIKNIVNQVNHPNPYNWNPESRWNQHVKLTAKGPIPVHKILNPDTYNKWHGNNYLFYPKNQVNKFVSSNINDYLPRNHEMLSHTLEHFPKGTNIYENADESDHDPWNPYPLNQNIITNGYHSSANYRPSIYDLSTWKDIIEITTRSPNLFREKQTAQIPHNSEGDYQPLVNYESITPNSDFFSLDTGNDDLPFNNENPWQLEIEVTTKYSMILHDSDYDNQHSIRDGDDLDSSAQSKENGNGEPKSELETSTLSLSTQNNNQPINKNPFKSNYTITPIVATDEINGKTEDVNEIEEPPQTLVYDSLNIAENPDHYFTSSEKNTTGLNSTEVNNLETNGLEPEPEVITLIEETIKNIEKNISTDTDPKLLESIEHIKRMINEPNLSINIYIQILRIFHYIQSHFKLYTNVGQVIPLSYLYRLINNNNTKTNGNNVVEITYLVESPKLIVIYPYYYVKYYIPETEIDNFLSKNLNTSENNEALHIKFLRLCIIADLSPALKKLSKDDVDQLVARNGHLIKTNISNSEVNVIRETHNIIKFNDTITSHTMNSNEDLIKEVRIKVNKNPYHTIRTVASDFRGTPIIEDRNSPKIDNLNDLSNPFRKIFPMHKLIRATELASVRRINDDVPWIPPFRRVDNNKAEDYSINREFNRNGLNTKHTRSGESLPYISTADDPKAFVVNSHGRNTDKIIPPIRRVHSDPNGKIYRDYIPSMGRFDNDLNGKKQVYRRDVGKVLNISPIRRDPNTRVGEM